MVKSNSPYALAIHISRESIDFFQRHPSAMGITAKRTKNSRKNKNISKHEDYIDALDASYNITYSERKRYEGIGILI
jgi:hypothetical protein